MFTIILMFVVLPLTATMLNKNNLVNKFKQTAIANTLKEIIVHKKPKPPQTTTMAETANIAYFAPHAQQTAVVVRKPSTWRVFTKNSDHLYNTLVEPYVIKHPCVKKPQSVTYVYLINQDVIKKTPLQLWQERFNWQNQNSGTSGEMQNTTFSTTNNQNVLYLPITTEKNRDVFISENYRITNFKRDVVYNATNYATQNLRLNKNPVLPQKAIQNPSDNLPEIIFLPASTIIPQELLEKKFWFLNNINSALIDELNVHNFFDNLNSFCNINGFASTTRFFSLILGATAITLIKKNFSPAAVYILMYLLFAHVTNRQDIQCLAARIPELSLLGKINFWDYLSEDNKIRANYKLVLEHLLAQNIFKLEELVIWGKCNTIIPEMVWFSDYLKVNANNKNSNEFIKTLEIHNRAGQAQPDLLKPPSKTCSGWFVDIKNIADNKKNFDFDYVLVKNNFNAAHKSIVESNKDIKDKLSTLGDNAYPEDIDKIQDFQKKLIYFETQYNKGDIDLLKYIEIFWKLHADNLYWILRYKTLTVNLPQMFTLDDFDQKSLENTKQAFIKQMCSYWEPNSDLQKSLALFVQRNQHFKKDRYFIFETIYKILFSHGQ